MRRLLVGVCLVAAAGCGPKKPSASEVAAIEMARVAHARVLEGCYDCLLEARDKYVALAAGRSRPAYALPLFEVELLLTLREKELAMDASASFGRAKALSAELSADVDGARYLAIVTAVPSNAMGLAYTENQAFRREHQPFVPQINAEIGWLETGPLQPAVREARIRLALTARTPQRPRPACAAAQHPRSRPPGPFIRTARRGARQRRGPGS
jgi:hypothetical protein